MSEHGGDDIGNALGWRNGVEVGGWGDKKPAKNEVFDQSRRDFLKVSAGVVIGVGLAASGIGGGSEVNASEGSLAGNILNDSEEIVSKETTESLTYDVMIDRLKEVSNALIGDLDHDYLESLKGQGIEGFGEISQKIQETWAGMLGVNEEDGQSRDEGLDGVWYAMLDGEITRETLEKLFVENIAGVYWAGEIVKSNGEQLEKLSEGNKSEKLDEQLNEGNVDYRQVVNGDDGKVDVERETEWDKRKYKTVRAVMMNLAQNSVESEICKRLGGESLSNLVGMVVSQVDNMDKNNWVWNGEKQMFEVNEGEKTKFAVDIAIGKVHDRDNESLVEIEEEILGMQETVENRKLAHGAWESFVESDGYNVENTGALDLARELVGFMEEELVTERILEEGEKLVNRDNMNKIIKGYADYYFSDQDRKKPNYRNVVELIRLMSVVNGVEEQIKEIKERGISNVPEGEEEYFQDWPRDEEGVVDWRKVDFALVQKRNIISLYQRGPFSDYEDRNKYGNLMPMRAFLANCMVGSDSFEQIERRWQNENGEFEFEEMEWRSVVKKALEVLVNTKTDDPWFERNEDGRWQTEFVNSAFGNVHTDGTSGSRKPSSLYNELVGMEKDKYD